MNMVIRNETLADQRAIFQLTKRAFAPMPFSAGDEQHLINALRNNGALFISMVAVQGKRVVGHIAFSPAKCSDSDEKWFALGPVAVEPELQGQRIGSALIEAGILRLKSIDASGCILTGNPNYYSRFGFKSFPALCPPGEPPEYFMMLPLLCASPCKVVEFHPLFRSTGGGGAN
jgi:putative acetyltransferase